LRTMRPADRLAASEPGNGEFKSTISKTTDNPYVRKFHYDETSTQISGENFASDQSCAAIPPLGSILYNHTVPPDGGGDTMFASMDAAYEALSPGMKAYLRD
jgi:taurine dioxygenase